MPIGGTTKEHHKKYWEFFYTYIIKKAMEERPIRNLKGSWITYECEQPKAGRENIMKDVVGKLKKADLVMAILTDKNANVWYELGVRHTLQFPAIMIMEEEEEIPFDINQYGILTYSKRMINKSRLLPLVHHLSFLKRAIWNKSYRSNTEEKIKKDEENEGIEYFDFHNRRYLGQSGFREKVYVEEYEKFKQRLQLLSEDKQKRIDNPVMEFVDQPRIQLISRTDKIRPEGSLEVRAELSRKDCSRIENAEAYFSVSDSRIAELKQDYPQQTDNYGVVYGKIEGKKEGETYVMVMASEEGQIEKGKTILYAHRQIKVKQEEKD